MPPDELVTVYHFQTFEDGAERPRVSSFKAPRDVIETRDGKVLEGTAERVGREALDADGRYRRIATGWGELD